MPKQYSGQTLFFAAFFALVFLGGAILTLRLDQYGKEKAFEEMELPLAFLERALSGELETIDNAVRSLSGSPYILEAIARPDNPQSLAAANSALDRYNACFKGAVSYLINKNGLTIASSNRAEKDSFVGKNYAFRPYFQEALADRQGRYWALGVTSGAEGYYSSYPVVLADKGIAGVVVLKKELKFMRALLGSFDLAFLVSPEGVIFLASDESLTLRAFWTIPEQQRNELIKSKQFGPGPFEAVQEKEISARARVTVKGRKFLATRYSIGNRGGWSLILLTSEDALILYPLVGLTLTCLFALVGFAAWWAIRQKDAHAAQMAIREKRFYDIVKSSGDGIWEIDGDDRYTLVIDFERVTGYKEQDLLGKTPFDFMPVPENEKIRQAFAEIKKQRLPIVDLENKCITSTGYIKFLLTNGVPIIGEDGSFLGYRGVDRDITEKKFKEAERKRLEQEVSLRGKLEAIGTLAAGIAHEISSPVQFINDNIHFLASSFNALTSLLKNSRTFFMGALPDDKKEDIAAKVDILEKEADLKFVLAESPKAFDQTQDGITRVAKIVGAMRDFAQVGVDEKVKADLNKAIDNTVTISRNVWKYAAEVEMELDPDLPLVSCYLNDVNQAVINILINAAHAIGDVVGQESGGKKGLIRIKTARKDANAVVISIADNGAGIPESVREKIFDPFFTTKGVGKGTGQGLSIAYKTIVEKNKGKLSFESDLGKGTTFYIELPIE